MLLTIICSSFKPNSASTNRLLSYLRALDEIGADVEVFFVYPNENWDRLDDLYFSHIKLFFLWEGHRCKNKFIKYLISFWDVWKFVRKLKPGSEVFLYGGSEYVPFFVRRKGIKVYHERTEHYLVAPLRPLFLQNAYLKSLPRMNGMFVISTALQEAYKAVGARNVVIVNMIVDVKRFAGLVETEQHEKYIAYCGTASNNKDGVDDLIKAFSIVHSYFPQLKLYVIGRAPTRKDASKNLELVSNLGLDGFVVFKGIVPASELPQMLKDAQIVALARPDSLQARCGFPTKLGEYLLSGNPVVVTRVGDIPLFLDDGRTALLAAPKDPDDFAGKLLWALNNDKEAKAIGAAGREVALRYFNYKTETEKIVNTIFKNQS